MLFWGFSQQKFTWKIFLFAKYIFTGFCDGKCSNRKYVEMNDTMQISNWKLQAFQYQVGKYHRSSILFLGSSLHIKKPLLERYKVKSQTTRCWKQNALISVIGGYNIYDHFKEIREQIYYNFPFRAIFPITVW